MSDVIRLLLAVWMALLSVGCATVMHGSHQRIWIDSTPQNAAATIHPGDMTLTTPAEVELPRKDSYQVQYDLDGYERKIGYIDREHSGAIWGNILIGGLVGLMVDHSTGAAYQLNPIHLTVQLEPKPHTSQGPAESKDVGTGP